jgi:WD40 repeat protein
VYCPQLALSGVTAVSGSADGSAAFVGAERGRIARVAVNADGTWGAMLASATISLPKTVFVADKTQGILSLAPHPDGTVVAFAYSNVVGILDAQTLAVLGWCDDRHSEGVVDLHWAGPSMIASASLDGLAALATPPTCPDFDSSSLDMAVLSDGQPLEWIRTLQDGTAVTGSAVGTIIHWAISAWSATPLDRRAVDRDISEALLPAGVRGLTADALCGVGPAALHEDLVWFRTNGTGSLGINGGDLIDTPHTDVIRSLTVLAVDGRQVLLTCSEDGSSAAWSIKGGVGHRRGAADDDADRKRRR